MISSSELGAKTAPWEVFPGEHFPLDSEKFAADPHRVYAEMRRRHGSLVPVELTQGVPATLVTGYYAALRVLNDPDRFPADPREWERSLPAECPIRPMTEWRPNAIRSAGSDHARYRSAIGSALDRLDLHQLRSTVEEISVSLINSICHVGTCDVVAEYALPVAFGTLNAMLGCPHEIAEEVGAGLAAIFDTVDAEAGNRRLEAALLKLARIKRADPGADVTSWLIQHPAELDDNEIMHQLVLLFAAGIEPPLNLIANTLLLIMTREQFAGHVMDGSISTQEALDEVLFNDPPLANYCLTYPTQPVLVDDVWLPPHQPVLISITACNNDPAIRTRGVTDNRSHLAFSTGPHACPARTAAEMIVIEALDQLLDAIPEVELGVEQGGLQWRPGPFHRSLESLPVRFPPSPPIHLRARSTSNQDRS